MAEATADCGSRGRISRPAAGRGQLQLPRRAPASAVLDEKDREFLGATARDRTRNPGRTKSQAPYTPLVAPGAHASSGFRRDSRAFHADQRFASSSSCACGLCCVTRPSRSTTRTPKSPASRQTSRFTRTGFQLLLALRAARSPKRCASQFVTPAHAEASDREQRRLQYPTRAVRTWHQ